MQNIAHFAGLWELSWLLREASEECSVHVHFVCLFVVVVTVLFVVFVLFGENGFYSICQADVNPPVSALPYARREHVCYHTQVITINAVHMLASSINNSQFVFTLMTLTRIALHLFHSFFKLTFFLL